MIKRYVLLLKIMLLYQYLGEKDGLLQVYLVETQVPTGGGNRQERGGSRPHRPFKLIRGRHSIAAASAPASDHATPGRFTSFAEYL